MSRRDGTTTKVFVGSLPSAASPDDLRKLFEPYGNIVECDIANKCGFLHLEDGVLAEKAIDELNNTFFMGARISVEKGRVKPPKSRRGDGPPRGGRDRGGPYSRNDDFGRGSRNGMGYDDRDYGFDRYEAYERGMISRGYGSLYDSYDRRPMYDDRMRDYLDDRRGDSNGYGRLLNDRYADSRDPYDEGRSGYPDGRGANLDRGGFSDSRGGNPDRGGYSDARDDLYDRPGYDDRRPAADDRRAPAVEPRPLLDSSASRPTGGFDRSGSSDMFSRRGDPPSASKNLSGYGERNSSFGNYGSSGTAGGDNFSSNTGYGGGSLAGGYGGSSGFGSGSAGGQSSATDRYGATEIGSGGGGYGGGSTTASGGTGGGYGSGGGRGYTGSSGGGGGGAASSNYGTMGGSSGYGDSYGASRGGYDDMYSRGPSSGGGGLRDRENEPRRGMPMSSGAERRY